MSGGAMLFILGLLCGSGIDLVHGQSPKETSSLINNLTANYNVLVRPVANQSNILNVSVQLYPLSLLEFDEIKESLAITFLVQTEWNDVSLTWDPTLYGNTKYVHLGANQIWTPNLVIINPSEKFKVIGADIEKPSAIAHSNGNMSLVTGDIIKTSCSVDIKAYPYDVQTCDIKLYAWPYVATELVFLVTLDKMNMAYFEANGVWSIADTAQTEFRFGSTSMFKGQVTLRRKPSFIMSNVILPLLCISLLKSLVFVLPASSGERVSFSITVLLASAVFLTIVSDNLPKTSEPMSALSFYILTDIIFSCFVCVLVVVNLHLYDSKDPVPRWIRRLAHRLQGGRNQVTELEWSKHQGGRNKVTEPEWSKNQGGRNKVTEPDWSKPQTSLADTEELPAAGKAFRSIKADTGTFEGKAKEGPGELETKCDWKAVTLMLDKVAFVVFSVCSILSFTLFIIVTQVAA